ncbi:MAG: AmmeMemoRadiSam system protein B [Magnetococcales bacterium]|nr:AmmeMemoRadiSam system protein B [Magnetococcales bacterium]
MSRMIPLCLAVATSLLMGLTPEGRAEETATPPESAAPVREVLPPSVAGSWYPAEAVELKAMLAGFLAQAKALPEGEAIRALIVPHAGYPYSGATAAEAFKQVENRSFRRVVIVGPGHRLNQPGLVLPGVSHLATPLGEIAVDRAAVARLSASPLAMEQSRAFRGEHSLEMQLPFLQQVLKPGWQVVPILLGAMEADLLTMVAELVRPLLDAETLLVVSGDFTHYGPQYDYQPFALDEQTENRLRELDMGAWRRIVEHDAPGFAAYRQRTGITACAYRPVMLLLQLLDKESTVQLARYETSGARTGNFTNSVSYLAGVIRDRQPLSNPSETGALPDEQMRLLLQLARKALHQGVGGGGQGVNADQLVTGMALPESLHRRSGAFVTLKEKGELRGCIGHILPTQPLYRAVVENALNAALRDRRFHPVQSGELPLLELEVSVLSPLRPIPGPEAFEVGKHGVVLSKQGRQAVFLPEVAVEQGWTREETLSQLALKAGLPRDGWKTGASFQVFTSQSLSAPFQGE